MSKKNIEKSVKKYIGDSVTLPRYLFQAQLRLNAVIEEKIQAYNESQSDPKKKIEIASMGNMVIFLGMIESHVDCYHGYKSITTQLKISRKTLSKLIKLLYNIGFIEYAQGGSFKNLNNRYLVRWDVIDSYMIDLEQENKAKKKRAEKRFKLEAEKKVTPESECKKETRNGKKVHSNNLDYNNINKISKSKFHANLSAPPEFHDVLQRVRSPRVFEQEVLKAKKLSYDTGVPIDRIIRVAEYLLEHNSTNGKTIILPFSYLCKGNALENTLKRITRELDDHTQIERYFEMQEHGHSRRAMQHFFNNELNPRQRLAVNQKLITRAL